MVACTQDLLSGQFNVTLGDKLSEHLKKWIDVTNVLQPPQPVSTGALTGWRRFSAQWGLWLEQSGGYLPHH